MGSRKRIKRQLWNDDFEKAIQDKKAMKKRDLDRRNESTIKKKKTSHRTRVLRER